MRRRWIATAQHRRPADRPSSSARPVRRGHRAALTVVRCHGTLREGGAFEREHLEVLGVRDGRVARLEPYELDDLERAAARVQALNPDATRMLREDRPEHGQARPEDLSGMSVPGFEG